MHWQGRPGRPRAGAPRDDELMFNRSSTWFFWGDALAEPQLVYWYRLRLAKDLSTGNVVEAANASERLPEGQSSHWSLQCF